MSQEEREAAAADTALYAAAARRRRRRGRRLHAGAARAAARAAVEPRRRGEEEAAERLCELTATYDESGGTWAFTIGGTAVSPLDARAVLSPCKAPSVVKPLGGGGGGAARAFSEVKSSGCCAARSTRAPPPDDEGLQRRRRPRRRCSAIGLTSRLELFDRLHAVAAAAGGAAPTRASCGALGAAGGVGRGLAGDVARHAAPHHDARRPPRVDRPGADGTGTGNDLSEGTVYRMLHALEALYPAALVKEGAMRWRVVPRGAGYHHLLDALTSLGRGEIEPSVEPHKTAGRRRLAAAVGRWSRCGGGSAPAQPAVDKAAAEAMKVADHRRCGAADSNGNKAPRRAPLAPAGASGHAGHRGW